MMDVGLGVEVTDGGATLCAGGGLGGADAAGGAVGADAGAGATVPYGAGEAVTGGPGDGVVGAAGTVAPGVAVAATSTSCVGEGVETGASVAETGDATVGGGRTVADGPLGRGGALRIAIADGRISSRGSSAAVPMTAPITAPTMSRRNCWSALIPR
jgi:hypothetical protein